MADLFCRLERTPLAGWFRPASHTFDTPIHPSILTSIFYSFLTCNYFFFQMITAPVMFLPGSGDVRNIKKSSPAVAAAVPQNHSPHQQQEGNLLPPATQCLCLARLHLQAPRVCFKWPPNEMISKPTQQVWVHVAREKNYGRVVNTTITTTTAIAYFAPGL